ncbi:MAG: hypothetical protein L6R38_005817 [Xanthoria sp. 2 TBL-2021]|nr:MAG: hypothetical protein L6R38_005817 [Xanthoria sp. 2 TBL-2021]
MSINSGTSPAHLRIPENRFTLSSGTPVNRNAISEVNAADRVPSPTEPSLTVNPYGSERSPDDRPHRRTAYPQPSYSPSSFFDDSPLVQAFNEADEEQTNVATPTTRSLDPPRTPGYRFGPLPLEVANPDNDPEFDDAIFVSTKADRQPMGSYQATEGSALPADFMEYKVHVDEQFVEARRILAKSMQERKSLERQHAQQRAAWQDELERARVAANRWTRPVGAIVRRPKLISDQEIEAEAYQVGFNGNTEFAHEELPFAESEKHPPLYNNFPDRLRQMAVEILLQRSKVAYTLKDWNTMDSSSRQAYNLATYFKWEPYLARSAFWIGIALYHRKKWTEAYEAFEEADKTNGYYIARRIILHWLRETSKRLEGSPWSTGLSAIRGENPPVLTPLDTVVEEEDSFPFPDTGNPYRADQKDAPSNTVAPTDDESIHATETILLAYDPVPQRIAGSGEIDLGRNAQSRVVAASPKDRRVKPQPKAITLPSIVEPPRVRTPRLYEPQPSGGLSVAENDESSSLEMGQSLATTSVSETSVNASQESQSASEEEYRVRPLD